MDLLTFRRRHHHHHHIIHESSSSPPPLLNPHAHSSHSTNFPIIAVAIIGIFATILLLVFYYIFVIKCCLNWHRIDILRRFSLSRNTNHHRDSTFLRHYSPSPVNTGLHESVIRSIPIFQFQHSDSNSDSECAVCLTQFRHHEKLRLIPNCAHVFHIDCIDVWLQNNPNCPLCRTSISISIPAHFPRFDEQENPQDYVVIELSGSGGGEGRNNGAGEDERTNSGEPISINPSPRKLEKKIRRKRGHVSSMGDECIDVVSRGKGDEQFSIQPIRRSFSMDSASDRQLYLAVQEIIQGKMMNHEDEIEASLLSSSSSSSRLRRGFFSFGHARSAVLPLHLQT